MFALLALLPLIVLAATVKPGGHAPPLTLTEAAAYLNRSPRFMRRLVAERRIAHLKFGARVMFDAADLDAYLAAQRVEAEPWGGA